MDIRQLKQLLVIEDSGSFSSAAEKLYISRPAISKSIAGLEKEIGTPLFERWYNKSVLNDIGKSLLPKVREVVSAYESLEKDIVELRTKPQILHIGFTYGIHCVFLDSLSAFEERHPDIKIEISDCSFDSIPQLLQSGVLDVGCTGADYSDSGLKYIPIHRCEILWGVKIDSHIAKRGYVLEEEVQSMPHCIPKGSTMEAILKVGDNGKMEPDDYTYQRILDDNMFYLCKLVERGKGIIPIGRDAIPDAIKGIVFVPCPECPRYWEIQAYFSNQKCGKALGLLLKEVFTVC